MSPSEFRARFVRSRPVRSVLNGVKLEALHVLLLRGRRRLGLRQVGLEAVAELKSGRPRLRDRVAGLPKMFLTLILTRLEVT